MKKILILNGPNLNTLGTREPEIYGTETLDDVIRDCEDLADTLGVTVTALQTNHEGVLVDAIQDARGTEDAIIINAGAFTHTSVAIFDALNLFQGKLIEVHISNIHAREAFRHHSFISPRADGVIVGCGTHGYGLAMRHVTHLLG